MNQAYTSCTDVFQDIQENKTCSSEYLHANACRNGIFELVGPSRTFLPDLVGHIFQCLGKVYSLEFTKHGAHGTRVPRPSPRADPGSVSNLHWMSTVPACS